MVTYATPVVLRMPAVVATAGQQIDLVVMSRAMLHRPHLVGAGAPGQALGVAVAVGIDQRRIRGGEGVAWRPGPGGGVHPQDLPTQGGQALRDVTGSCRVARRDPQVALWPEAQPTAAVTPASGYAAHEKGRQPG